MKLEIGKKTAKEVDSCRIQLQTVCHITHYLQTICISNYTFSLSPLTNSHLLFFPTIPHSQTLLHFHSIFLPFPNLITFLNL